MSEEGKILDSLKRVTIELRGARERLREVEERAAEPIAIVGMSCRFPGGVTSPEELWEQLLAGGDGISTFPEDRNWPLDRLFDPDPDHPGTSYVREGGFVDATGFDAEFFGIAPREARAMDPQQRLLLEATWEAFEDAGIDPDSAAGRAVGVFAGMMYHDYGWGTSEEADAEGYYGIGKAGSVLSGRLAYSFGFEGPAVTIDTACSSSLVAMHLAAAALRSGECELALAGGVSALGTPGSFVELSRQRGMAPDGRCKAFDAAADGMAMSEGCGLVLLERLSDAQRNGREVLALLRGSAVNQDGASNGLTAPNGPSQERVIRQALASAGLSAAEVDAIEAHGTGTPLGDPIEAQALLATYGRARNGSGPLALGSVKSNLGHTQAAAGVAGVIKMVQALRHERLPRTIHLSEPTPHVDWSAGEIELLREEREWPRGESPRRAGVSSFGISGTNVHLILEEAPPAGSAPEPPPEPPLSPLLLSARDGTALREMGARLAGHLRSRPEQGLAEVAATLATARARLPRRAAVLGADRAEAVAALEALGRGAPHEKLLEGRARDGRLCFLFPGQGPQWVGMGRELLAGSEVFAGRIDECEEALAPHVSFSLREVLTGEAHSEAVAVIQPALFSVMVALAELWRSNGVVPDAVLGHSQGEIAAACVAGALSLEDAARVVALRSGVLARRLAGKGGMVSVHLPAEEARELIGPWGERLSVAAINSPTATVIAGGNEALEELLERCAAEGVPARRLALDCPSHSAQVDVTHDELLEALAPIAPCAAEIPVYSAMTGEPIAGAELGPEYWYASMREPVLFHPAISRLLADGHTAFVETSAHPVLVPAVAECAAAAGREVAAVPTLRREEGSPQRFAAALAEAHLAGAEPDWGAYFGERPRVPLPTYPFQRSRYWLEGRGPGSSDPAAIGQADAGHPFLASLVSLPNEEGWLATGRVSLHEHPWLADHVLLGSAVLPGTAFLELGLKAAEIAGAECLADLAIEAPMVIPEQGAVALQLRIGAGDEQGRRPLEIHSRPDSDAEWTRHASGSIADQAPPPPEPIDAWPPPGAEQLEVSGFYARAAELGIDYGPAFQGLKAAWRRGEELFAEVELDPETAAEAGSFAVHPALLDAAVQTGLAGGGEGEELRIPFSWEGVRLDRGGASALRVRLSGGGEQPAMVLATATGEPVASIGALAARPVDPAALRSAAGGAAASLYRVDWEELDLPEVPEPEDGPAPIRLQGDPELDPPSAARALCAEVLATLQEAIASEGQGRPIAFLAAGAVAAVEADVPDPALAAAWGLVRSAQAEHPGRFALIDSDGSEASGAALPAALAIEGESELALRGGRALVPRLAPVAGPEQSAPAYDPEGTILITGGTGTIGSLLARHLVSVHGARHLVLTSRRGPEAPGARELLAELEELGAEAEVRACDAADRAQLEGLFASLPAEHPPVAVLHCAGDTDDGLIDALDPERLGTTMAPKADAAWFLHELTRETPACELVLFSSIAGTFQTPGQGNYAAANAFLDALAQQRAAEGLAGVSVGWGSWATRSELTGKLSDADLARIHRSGVLDFDDAEGLALHEASRALGAPFALATKIDRAALRAAARLGAMPPLFSGLVRVPARHAAAGSLAARLAAAPETERQGIALELVRSHVAVVLGHDSAEAVDPAAAFKDLGFDSLSAVELRNRLGAASGLQLPATLVFDHPSAEAVARYLVAQAGGAPDAGPRAAVRPVRDPEEPIAIVGMSCRFPGADSPEALWQLLCEGADAIGPFPEDRGWDLGRSEEAGLEGGFVADATRFDAPFFGLHAQEARTTDPQQRLLLETAWETLENAGIDPRALRGSSTGVYAGVMYQDYAAGLAEMAGDGAVPMGGVGGSLVSGRVAYSFGFEGPAVTIDTACSSSLVAMHLAAQALRGGECDLALAGGVTVLSTPFVLAAMGRQGGLSRDGRCKAFDAGADGIGMSEGVGLVLLERLSEAQSNGHRVLALLRGSATNQDGASNGITAPNGPSQERVIRQALASAGLAPADVDAVEAHGTGTALGDPIEAQALLATYGQAREGSPLALGSIKSNLGHAQAAAGVAGVIKMVQALRHERLPRTIHLSEPTPHVDWSTGEVELLADEREWRANGRPRRAGVSSFGISGTNAHLILEEAPPSPAPSRAGGEVPDPAPGVPLVLSARSEGALREGAGRLRAFMQANPETATAEIARSLARRRPLLERRAALAGAGREELLDGLAALAAGEEAERVFLAPEPAPELGSGPVFLFPGQGAQWRKMALELLGSSPLFAAAIDECEQALEPHVEWSLGALLRVEEGAADLERIEVVQPALFAMMVALARLWRAHGVEPAAVLGHSQGEIAAAHVAGALSLDDAAQLVARRSQVLTLGTGRGAMALVAAGEPALDARIPAWRDLVSLGGVNSPDSVVVSGSNEGIDEVLGLCEAEGIFTHRVRAAVGPGHSPLIEQGREMLLEAAAGISPRPSEVPFYSCVTAAPVDTAGLDAEYWYRNARQAVLYGPAVARLLGDGFRRFVEVSPNPILLVPTHENFAHVLGEEEAGASFTGTLQRKRGGLPDFALALGSAWAAGVEVDWSRALPGGAEDVTLPGYAFQREHYWGAPAALGAGDASASGQEPAGHPLLAAAVPSAAEDSWVFTGRLSAETSPWLSEHGGMGVVLVPGTAIAELALHAGARTGCEVLRELNLEAPLVLPAGEAVQVQLTLSARDGEGLRAVALHSRPERGPQEGGGGWTRHATGVLAKAAEDAAQPGGEWPPAGAEPIDVGGFYERIAALGIEYGPAFQGLRAAWRRGEEIFAEIELEAGVAETASDYGIHPALFDAALHSSALFFLGEGEAEAAGPRLPFAFTDVRLGSRGLRSLRAVLTVEEGGAVSVRASGPDGEPAVSVGSMVMRPIPSGYLAAAAGAGEAIFSLDWEPVELEPSAAGEEAPPTAVHRIRPDAEAADPAAAAHAAAAEALAAAQGHLAGEEGGARLVFVTSGAIAAAPGDPVANLGQAAAWGLLRSAQAEHPGRFGLIDLDGSEASEELLEVALASVEPQLALREGRALAARLRRGALADDPRPPALDPDGTLLVTGGTGDLGGLVARHLIAAHGVGDVLLASRSGAAAPGAGELKAELEELGARVEIAACDVADRDQIERLLGSIDPDHPLTGVVHTAVSLDDGVLGEMTPERLDRVLRPKADAAWHLHELTADAELGAFVLFSSLAGTLGSPGQSNYAAANVFLDSLAARRAALGLPATSIAWGLWERTLRRGEEELDELDLARVMGTGLAPIPDELGLELLDAALCGPAAATVAARLNLAIWRVRAAAIGVPPVLRELVPDAPARGGAAGGESLPRLLAGVPEEERGGVALDFVRRRLADVLGHESPLEIDPERPFLELGFDSLTALQFRNTLNAATGLELMPSVALDHPTPAALAAHVLEQIDDVADAGEGGEEGGQTIATLLRSAHAEGRSAEFLSLVAAMAGYRPTFADPAEAELRSLRLADGPASPALVCVPSAAPISGPHEYARLARSFRDARPVHALRWPGFLAGEPLPANASAALELQVEALRRLGLEAPVLLGHSTGGALAYAIAQRLEQLGEGPAAVVLIDSYHPGEIDFDASAGSRATHAIGLGVLGDLLAMEGSSVAIDDARLTATAAYLKLVSEIEVEPIAAPVLLLRAAEPIGGDPGDDWQPAWQLPIDSVEVPGNHLSMMDAHASASAEAISGWLAEAVSGARVGKATEGSEVSA